MESMAATRVPLSQKKATVDDNFNHKFFKTEIKRYLKLSNVKGS